MKCLELPKLKTPYYSIGICVFLHRKQDFSWFSVQTIITLHALITNYEEELDVMPYIKNPQELTIWSNEYFLQLAERIVWKQE